MDKTKILIVEDQILVSTNIRLLLKFNGYEIFGIVTSAEEALDSLNNDEKPDLILMDIMLPGKMDGIEAADLIFKKWNIPVIFLTARTDSKTIQRAKETSAYGYLTKDIQLKDQLPILVEFVLYKHKMEIQQKKAEQKLRDSEEKFRTIVSSAQDAIVFFDSESNISFWNHAASNIFGYTPEQVINRNIADILSPKHMFNDFKSIFDDFDNIENDKFKQTFELDAISHDGNIIPIDVSLSPIKLKDQWCGCSIIRDITDRRNSQSEMEKLIEELQISKDIIEQNANDVITLNLRLTESEEKLKELNASKDKFFSIIAHDLKGPFQGLMGYSEVLSKDIENLSKDEIKEFASDLHTSAKHLFRLLENLLQWTRIQRGIIECHPTSLRIAQLASMSIDLSSFNAHKKNISIENNIDPELHLIADMNMINTVLRNLISNAVKFTPENGSITLSSEQFEDFSEIHISDTGVGISEEDMTKIFNLDAHHTTIGTNNEKGTGLGLILCKDLIEKNNGQIKVNSTPEQGTTFTFSLPNATPDNIENQILE